jgi:hypothetical protein
MAPWPAVLPKSGFYPKLLTGFTIYALGRGLLQGKPGWWLMILGRCGATSLQPTHRCGDFVFASFKPRAFDSVLGTTSLLAAPLWSQAPDIQRLSVYSPPRQLPTGCKRQRRHVMSGWLNFSVWERSAREEGSNVAIPYNNVDESSVPDWARVQGRNFALSQFIVDGRGLVPTGCCQSSWRFLGTADKLSRKFPAAVYQRHHGSFTAR